VLKESNISPSVLFKGTTETPATQSAALVTSTIVDQADVELTLARVRRDYVVLFDGATQRIAALRKRNDGVTDPASKKATADKIKAAEDKLAAAKTAFEKAVPPKPASGADSLLVAAQAADDAVIKALRKVQVTFDAADREIEAAKALTAQAEASKEKRKHLTAFNAFKDELASVQSGLDVVQSDLAGRT